MAYRMTYSVQVIWVGPGLGPMGGALAPPLPQGPAGGAQVLELQNTANFAGLTTNTFLTADVTTLTNAMAADIAAQCNVAATLARIQAFSTGGG
jgi:hypothetical protein